MGFWGAGAKERILINTPPTTYQVPQSNYRYRSNGHVTNACQWPLAHVYEVHMLC